MSFRTKIWFFNAGFAGGYALLLALGGHPACFLFGIWSAFNWYIGDSMVEKELIEKEIKKGE